MSSSPWSAGVPAGWSRGVSPRWRRDAARPAAGTAAFRSGVHYAIVNDFAGRVAIITGA